MKINNIEIKADKFAYDGCHKIYLLESKADEIESKKLGYKILPIEKIKEVYANSCPLRFISNWNLKKPFAFQCENAVIEQPTA